MSGPRVSVASLSGIVAFSGLALGCLLYASSPWAKLVVLGHCAALGIAPLGVAYQRGNRRAFYLGFTLWIWAYLLLMSIAGSVPQRASKSLLSWAYPKLIIPSRIPSSALRYMLLPQVDLEEGQRLEDMIGTVDIHIKDDPYPLVEGIQVQGARTIVRRTKKGGVPFAVRLSLIGTDQQSERLNQAVAEGKAFRVVRHKPRPALHLLHRMAAPPVDQTSFIEVGNSVLGLSVAVIGGLIGRWFPHPWCGSLREVSRQALHRGDLGDLVKVEE